MRSNGEATNAAIKRKFGEMLKSKKLFALVDELLAKIIMYIWWLLFANYTRTGFKASPILYYPHPSYVYRHTGSVPFERKACSPLWAEP
nr:hypothetical protein [uncultured Methanoregula sp.]